MSLRHALPLAFLLGTTTFAQNTTPAPYSHKPYPTATPLATQIGVLLADPAVARAHWGIAVTTLDGTPVYGHDEDKFFRPASTAKLFTTAAAMALLHPASTVTTDYFLPAPDADGTSTGDFEFVGGEDADLSGRSFPWTTRPATSTDPLHFFTEVASNLAAKGVRHITGDIVVHGTNWSPYPQGWEEEDLVWGYGAPVWAPAVNENQLQLTVIAAAQPGAPASVTLSPDIGFYKIVSAVTTVAADATPASIAIHHALGNGTLRITGALPVGKTYTEDIAIDDPPAFLGIALRQALFAQGITVDGVVRAQHTEPPETAFLHEAQLPIRKDIGMMASSDDTGISLHPVLRFSHTSPPLSQDVTAAMKESLNLHAEIILLRLAWTPRLPLDFSAAPRAEGARVVHQFLVDIGVDPLDFILYDGSGLSTKDLVTPRATARVLAYVATQPWFPQWKAALPLGGIDGTLTHRFLDSPLKGHVFAKTGTLGESRALSGYLDAASGRTVIFSILVDNHTPGTPADRAIMDKIVAAIAAAN